MTVMIATFHYLKRELSKCVAWKNIQGVWLCGKCSTKLGRIVDLRKPLAIQSPATLQRGLAHRMIQQRSKKDTPPVTEK
jgi:hypothetical protein